MHDVVLEQDSNYLFSLLTTDLAVANLTKDDNGYVDVHTLCHNTKFTPSYLELIVSEDYRFELTLDRRLIRIRG